MRARPRVVRLRADLRERPAVGPVGPFATVWVVTHASARARRREGPGSVCDVPLSTPGSATGQPGSARRACEAPSSTGAGARARSAPRDLTRRACPSAANAVSTASCATGPRTRAAQGSRSAAKTASPERRALPGCAVAKPLPEEPEFNDGKGPQEDCHCFLPTTAHSLGRPKRRYERFIPLLLRLPARCSRARCRRPSRWRR
jgi:hypothetical protein